MISEAELLENFDLDELDDTRHECLLILYTGTQESRKNLVADLRAEGKKVDEELSFSTGVAVVKTALTINEMCAVAGRWSCIKSIERQKKNV